MVRKDGAEARKDRLKEIAESIQRGLYKQQELSLSTTVAQIQYDFGLTEGKASEYVKLLERLGRFTLNEKEDKITKISQS